MTEAPVRKRTRQLDLEAPEALIEVSRAVYGVETDTSEKVRVSRFEQPPAFVEVEGSRTVNLGDYNSARVAVKVKLPCYAEASEISRAYNIASELVERYMENELKLATGVSNG